MGNDPLERVWEMNYLSSGDEEPKCDSTMTWNEVWKYYNLIYLLLVEEKNKRTPLHLSYSSTVEPLICQRQFSWSLSSPQISMIPALMVDFMSSGFLLSVSSCWALSYHGSVNPLCRTMTTLLCERICLKSNPCFVYSRFDQLRQNNTLCELIISFMFFCFCVCVCMFVKAGRLTLPTVIS